MSRSRQPLLAALCPVLVTACLFSTSLAGPGRAEVADPLVDRFLSDVEILAADDMEGRGLGTRGLVRAGEWIEARFRSLELPGAFDGDYHQAFDVKTGISLGEGNRLEGVADDAWTPLAPSSSGEFAGELAFVGYGIEAPEVGFDELAGLDLDGKVVLMLRFEPQERDDASPFEGRRPSRWSAVRYRVHRARERGAAAVVFARGPLQDEGRDTLPPLRNDGPESPAGLPVLQVTTSVASEWLSRVGVDLAEWQREVDLDLLPRPAASTGIRVEGRVAVEPTTARTTNVAAVLPGRGEAAGETIVLGAHYDHLGHGGPGSMRPNESAIHNGADDNASGTVGVLLAAEELATRLADVRERRTVVFALFSAEETGLGGSAAFVDDPPTPIESVRAMINLDMIGRLRDDEGLVALGADTAPEWKPLLADLSTAHEVDVAPSGDGYGPSDQTSFYAAGIPVLHFFTGAHAEYHTPDDDPGTLEGPGSAKVVRLITDVVDALARGDVDPTYVRAGSQPMMEGDSRGFRSYLGTIPDYSEMGGAEEGTRGVLLADVRAGGPADLAGLRGGDRILAMAGTGIENLHDMTFVLQDHRPGETIGLVVERDGSEVELSATLGTRGTTPKPPETDTAAAPADPHAGMALPSEEPEPGFELPEWFRGRPGADFAIGAGEPFPDRADEPRLRDVRQLTFGGENAEAYFSPDGTKLVYQARTGGDDCDQQFVLDLATGGVERVSTGTGRTTCGYYDWPEADRIVYASTHGADPACPAPPDRSQGYVWPLYETYDLWAVPVGGGEPERLTDTPGYDAEATWCHRGGSLVFTSVRDGDLDLYRMDEAGNVERLTEEPGYDGGAFYSPDCSRIVWRASRPEGEDLEDYRRLLAEGLVRPGALEIFVMDADGSNARQVTDNGAANFGPYFHPDGRRVIFSTNAGADRPMEFDLWLVDSEGTSEPERITSAPSFDGFPMWSPDGEWIVWGSNRANPEGRSTNLFVARWIEDLGAGSTATTAEADSE